MRFRSTCTQTEKVRASYGGRHDHLETRLHADLERQEVVVTAPHAGVGVAVGGMAVHHEDLARAGPEPHSGNSGAVPAAVGGGAAVAGVGAGAEVALAGRGGEVDDGGPVCNSDARVSETDSATNRESITVLHQPVTSLGPAVMSRPIS